MFIKRLQLCKQTMQNHAHSHAHTHTEPYNDSAGKGKQMMVGGTKSKTAFQTGYFGKSFDRVMEVTGGAWRYLGMRLHFGVLKFRGSAAIFIEHTARCTSPNNFGIPMFPDLSPFAGEV